MSRISILFVNENTLGHSSYLLPFEKALRSQHDSKFQTHVIDIAPLAGLPGWAGGFSIPFLRKWGLDFGIARWRLVASRHARNRVLHHLRHSKADAIFINTQSVALSLTDLASRLPLAVALDATFAQLRDSAWFCPNPASRRLSRFTLAPILGSERALLSSARMLLPWSELAANSIRDNYHGTNAKIRVLPPSIDLTRVRSPIERIRGRRTACVLPRLLFIGGDFSRKGGPLLLECFRRHFAKRAELHILTEAPLHGEPGVVVRRGLKPYSPEWIAELDEADMFIFPSRLDTFGIVLLEALAFGVPIISARVGAAEELAARGAPVRLLPELSIPTLRGELELQLAAGGRRLEEANAARSVVETHYSLATNSALLAEWLEEIVCERRGP